MRFAEIVFTSLVTFTLSLGSACARDGDARVAEANQLVQSEATPAVVNKAQPVASEKLPPSKPDIVSREEWKAKEPRGEAKEHTIRFITIHHTGEAMRQSTSLEKKMQGLQSFSQSESRLASGKNKPAWFDVPYHFYISADGKIAEGRPIKYVGDTNTDYDPTGHALVVVEGNFETETPADAEMKSLEKLVAWLAAVYKVPVTDIKVHNDYASTACPGKNLKTLLPSLRAALGGK